MKLLLLEDLQLYETALQERLQQELPENQITIVRFDTEMAFRDAVPRLAKEDFDAAVFDVMVPWCRTDQVLEEKSQIIPPEVRSEMDGDTKWRAGLRCLRMFQSERRKAGSRPCPTFISTILDGPDLSDSLMPSDGILVVKDNGIQSLIAKLKHHLTKGR